MKIAFDHKNIIFVNLALQCHRQRPLRHGRLRCTNDNFIGSVCTFRCNESEGYVLFPDVAPAVTVSLTCESDEYWTGDRPCCTCKIFMVLLSFNNEFIWAVVDELMSLPVAIISSL